MCCVFRDSISTILFLFLIHQPSKYLIIVSDSKSYLFIRMETTHPFPTVPGPPGFLAIQGHIYHHLQPSHQNSAIHWLLYDSFMCNMVPFEDLADTLLLN